jgi:hypothetical protein
MAEVRRWLLQHPAKTGLYYLHQQFSKQLRHNRPRRVIQSRTHSLRFTLLRVGPRARPCPLTCSDVLLRAYEEAP